MPSENLFFIITFAGCCFFIFVSLEISNIWLKSQAKKFNKNKQKGQAIVTGYFQHRTNSGEQYSNRSGLMVKVQELDDKEYACNCQVYRRDYPVGTNVDVVYTKTSDGIFGTMVYLANETFDSELRTAKILHIAGIICLMLSVVLLVVGLM